MDNKTIVVRQKFATDGGNVYDGFLNPSIARRFLFATPAGTMVRAEIDGEVGGTYSLVDRREGVDVLHTGEFLELVRPSRIVFTLRVPKYSSETSTVRIEIVPAGEGCELALTHTGVLAEYAESTREGWAGILLAAEKTLAG